MKLARLAPLRHAIISIGAVIGCNAGIMEPQCDLCSELGVRTDYKAYRPTSYVGVTVTNRGTDTVRYDWCSVVERGRTADNVPFDTQYQPWLRCGAGAGLAQVVANMVTLAPGASVRDSAAVKLSALQGEHRVLIWLVHPDGSVRPGNPVYSNYFDVLNNAAH